MKKWIYSLAILASLAAVSCEEWEPVLGNQGEPEAPASVTLQPNMDIATLKALYAGNATHIEDDIIIGGQVTSSDASGNVYRTMYIQDETGGIEIKLGLTGTYNDYKLGQWVYVKCLGLTLGNYEGMLQVGMDDPTGEYETAYIDVKSLISAHVFKGKRDAPVAPVEVGESELTSKFLMGKYVTLKGLKYGNEIFCLIYPDADGDKKVNSNRIFLDEKTWGVTTWAMSANKFEEYALSGIWNSATLADGSKTMAELLKKGISKSAYSVSHYFKMGSTDVQVRTSGYAKFADTEIDSRVLDGTASVNLTGILTNYRGAPQFTLIDLDGVQVQ